MGKTMEISNILEEIPVTLKMKSGERKFVLREFVGHDRDAWFNFIGERATIDEQGKATNITNFEGLQARLLSLCMFDEKDNKVTEGFIQKELKAKVITELFEAAQELNGLNVGAEEEAKND